MVHEFSSPIVHAKSDQSALKLKIFAETKFLQTSNHTNSSDLTMEFVDKNSKVHIGQFDAF